MENKIQTEHKEIRVKIKERFEIEVYRAIKYNSHWMTELSGGVALISAEPSRNNSNLWCYSFCTHKEGTYVAKFSNFNIVDVIPGDEIVYNIIVEKR